MNSTALPAILLPPPQGGEDALKADEGDRLATEVPEACARHLSYRSSNQAQSRSGFRGLLVLSLIIAFTEAVSGDDLFRTRIAPIFERRCLGCHNTEEAKGGLSLVSSKSLKAGGDSGEVVLPKDAEGSYLLELVTPEGGRAKMPKDADPLKPEEIAAIREWIQSGAAWPGDLQLSVARLASTDWWSLKPIVRPPVPSVDAQDLAWVRTPIDAFVLAKHTEHGLWHAPEADRRTLIRRLSYDLIGLPPSPEEIKAFESDADPKAYEKLVNRLLDSSHYGERWARHWLDVVHFGETHGYDKDKPRPNAWPYRDYVIRSFNSDKPYSKFLEEQIAGDVVSPGTRDGYEALGFISAGPWDFIGHAEVPESKIDGKVARHLDRDDMITNTLQTFCSLTVQCAQCHNHKFDPISQEDYYRLQAVFAAVDRADKAYDSDPQVATRRHELTQAKLSLTRQQADLDAQIARRAGQPFLDVTARIAELEKNARPATHPPEFGYHSGIADSQESLKWVQVDLGRSVALSKVVLRPCHDDFNGIGDGFGFPRRYRLELSDDPEFKNPVVLEDHTADDVANPKLVPQVTQVDGKSGRFLRLTATKLAPRLPIDFILAIAELEALDTTGKNIAKDAPVTSLDSIEAPVRWRKTNLVDGLFPGGQTNVEELTRLREDRTKLIEAATTPEDRDRLADMQEELRVVDSELARLPPQQVAYVGTVHTGSGTFTGTGASGGKPRPVFLLNRGNVTQPGKEVSPGAITSLTELPGVFELPTDHRESDRRAALARWLSDRRNPLTWRSIVNRVWQYHFGRGLVDSPNDFGRNGRPPTHPELLDWLAVEFRDGGQSLKSLHRMIVLSSVYRQSSRQANEKDADNQWLARMNRHKLDAEQVRDSVLLLAGKLDRALYGPSFQDFKVEKPEHSPHYEYHLHDPDDPRSHRRSIYRFLVRSQPQPFMATLDCADPSMQVEKRNESVSSLQALTLLNNAFMLRMSQHFAERIDAVPGELPEKVARAGHEAWGRPLTEKERATLTAFAGEHGLPNLCRALLNSNEFAFVD